MSITRDWRSYPGSGGIWIGDNEEHSDGNFEDWGLARAVAIIINALNNGQLVPAVTTGIRLPENAT